MKELRWHEPAAYRREIHRQRGVENFWQSARFVAWTVLVVLIARGMAGWEGRNPNLPSWTSTIGIAAVLSLLLAFVLPWLLLRLPSSIVILSDKGVNNNIIGHRVNITFWPWDEIAFCSTRVETFRGQSYETLSLHGAQGIVEATFGVAPKTGIENIEERLRLVGVPLRIAG